MNLININNETKVIEKNISYNSYVKKLLILGSIFFVAGIVVVIKLSEITLIDTKQYKSNNEIDSSKKKTRGIIYDRNNKILASNIFVYQLKAYPKLIINAKYTATLLKKEIPSLTKNKILKKLNEKTRSEVIIAKNVTPPNAKKINSLGVPGLEFFPVEKRFYPHQNLTSHLVGHINNNLKGVYGAERTFNEKLSKGNNIKLSIDTRVQYAVRDELIKSLKKYKAKSATAIVANINSSEILALVSLPDFNPNLSINPKKESYRNTATLNVYEMGSTFKIFTIAAALEYSDLKMTSSFDVSNPLRISNYTIKDYHPENRVLTTEEVFIKSSNIGSSLIALNKLGKQNMKSFYANLGILNYSKIDLSEKSKPLLPRKWGEIETATMSYGHGISITPMHMLEAASLIFSTTSNGSLSIEKDKKLNTKKNNIISTRTREKLIKLMEVNVTSGTAKRAKLEGYNIGGKTATGEKSNKQGSYDKKKLVSSFLAVFPSKNPTYISIVLFDEPYLNNKNNQTRYGATGGKTAAPTTARIVNRIAMFLDLPKEIEKNIELIVKNKDKFNFASY